MSNAYAIAEGGMIDIDTVSANARAAKINWLVKRCGYPVFNHTTDHIIDDVWRAFSFHYKAECVAVTIERKEP